MRPGILTRRWPGTWRTDRILEALAEKFDLRGRTGSGAPANRRWRFVGIGEWYSLQSHFDALTPLLTDPRLPEVVDDIVVEFGNALYQDTIDRFIAGQPVDNAGLRPVWRKTTQSPLETYDEPVYEQFFRTVRAVNWRLPAGKQIRVLLGDPPIDWSKSQTSMRCEHSVVRSARPIRRRWSRDRCWPRAIGR